MLYCGYNVPYFLQLQWLTIEASIASGFTGSDPQPASIAHNSLAFVTASLNELLAE